MSTEQGLLILALCPVQKRALGSSLPSVCCCALLALICEVVFREVPKNCPHQRAA